jgi:hypothetical protein
MTGSFTAARKWAAHSLPRLIVFAIGLHFLFSAMMAAEMTHLKRRTDWHTLLDEYRELREGPRDSLKHLPRIRPSPNNDRKRDQYQALHRDVDDNEKTKQEEQLVTADDNMTELFDELYVEHVFDISQQIQRTLPGAIRVMSCRWMSSSHEINSENCDYHQRRGHNLPDSTKRIVVFNPLEQERILCDGSRIGPASIRILGENDLSCSEPPRLFANVPTVEAKQEMEPIVLQFQSSGHATMPQFPCDVPCISSGRPHVVTRRYVKNTPFIIQFSMEGPQYYNELNINPKAHRIHHYYSTTNFRSEIPLPYFSFDEYGDAIRGTAVKYDEAIKGAVFLATNCDSRNSRERLVQSLLSNNVNVHSVGACLHNAEPPDGLTGKDAIMGKYLFSLAFENQVSMVSAVGCQSSIPCRLTLPHPPSKIKSAKTITSRRSYGGH